MRKTNHRGIVIVIAGPTGSGETSVSRAITKILPKTQITLTTTSRPPRPGEVNHRDYHFVSTAEFKRQIKQKKFLEYIHIHNRDTYYGTNRYDIANRLNQGINVIANLEWRGAKVMKRTFPGTLTIFLKPDKISRIKQRLLTRDPLTRAEFKKRLINAKNELKEAKFYDRRIINHDGKMADTVKRIIKIIKHHLSSLDTK
ncbi:MAG: hypothetical protein WC480_04305 [Patescibacteria group bacterium]